MLLDQKVRVAVILEVAWLKKCTRLWREAHLDVKSVKLMVLDHFLKFGCGFGWQAQWILHLAKSEQNVRDSQELQNSRRGTLQRICKEAGTVQETSPSEMLGGQGGILLQRCGN